MRIALVLATGLALLAAPSIRAQGAGEQRMGGGGNTGGNLPSTAIFTPPPPGILAPVPEDPSGDGGPSHGLSRATRARHAIAVLVVLDERDAKEVSTPAGWILHAETTATFAWSDAAEDVRRVRRALQALSEHPAMAGKTAAVIVFSAPGLPAIPPPAGAGSRPAVRIASGAS